MNLKLLVSGEDEHFVREDASFLRKRGVGTIICEPEYFSRIYELSKPDVILIDFQYPDERALSLLHGILENTLLSDVPVIFHVAERSCYVIHPRDLVNRAKRKLTADSLVDALKMCFSSNNVNHVPVMMPNKELAEYYMPQRA